MDEIKPVEEYRYLSQSQIDHIKSEFDKLGDNMEQMAGLLSLIDRYVRQNGKADGEYEALFTVVSTLDIMQSSQMEYEEVIKATYPILSAISFYDYLMMTGVLNPGDLHQLQDGAKFPFQGKGGIPTA